MNLTATSLSSSHSETTAKKAEPLTTKISLPTIWNKYDQASPGFTLSDQDLNRGGFSLVEILVVVAIMGVVAYVAMPSLTSQFKISLGSSTREIATIAKETYNASVMSGRVYRLAFDLDKDQFWVESGPTSALLDTAASRDKEERRKRFRKKDEEEAPAAEFSMDKSITRKKMSLPVGAEFEDVITEQFKEPVTKGMAYSHFFPHGVSEQSLIHLKDQAKHQITLQVTTILGRTNLIDGYASPESLEAKK